MAAQGGLDLKSAHRKSEPVDWLFVDEQHHQRGVFSVLAFFLFPLIAMFSLLGAWFGWF